MKIILKRKNFSEDHGEIIDEVNNLRRLNDADIIAERKKKRVGYRDSLIKAALGGSLGAGAGALIGGIKGGKQGAADGAKLLGALGAAIGGAKGLADRAEINEDIDFYNDRLRKLKRGSIRREKRDFDYLRNRPGDYTY